MSIEETAKVLLSGEPSRRRGYLTNVITTVNCLAVTATLAIWGLFIQWDIKSCLPELFAIKVAWAGMLSSILIGLWRFYVRFLDGEIIRLYPMIYMCETVLLPNEVISIKPPTKLSLVSKQNIVSENYEWVTVKNSYFGGRGHGVIDWFAVALIVFFCIISIYVANKHKVITIYWFGPPDLIGLLLIGNIVGLLFIIFGWLFWKNNEIKWPIPKGCVQQKRQNYLTRWFWIGNIFLCSLVILSRFVKRKEHTN